MKKFEYRIINITGKKPDALETEFNFMGQGGWELVSVSDQAAGLFSRAIFKKEINDPLADAKVSKEKSA